MVVLFQQFVVLLAQQVAHPDQLFVTALQTAVLPKDEPQDRDQHDQENPASQIVRDISFCCWAIFEITASLIFTTAEEELGIRVTDLQRIASSKVEPM